MCMFLAHKKKKAARCLRSMLSFIKTWGRNEKTAALLPGENYPGQIAANKKRGSKIYKERLVSGATYRQLGIEHGGLSAGRVFQIFHKEKRRMLRLLVENGIVGKIGIEKHSPLWWELYKVEEEKVEKQIAESKKRYRGKRARPDETE